MNNIIWFNRNLWDALSFIFDSSMLTFNICKYFLLVVCITCSNICPVVCVYPNRLILLIWYKLCSESIQIDLCTLGNYANITSTNIAQTGGNFTILWLYKQPQCCFNYKDFLCNWIKCTIQPNIISRSYHIIL